MADPPQTVTKADTDGDPPKPKGYTAAKVFSTPELMEGILLNLFTRQLFGVLRTCKTFKDTIDGSVKLQRAMFLKLDPSVTFDPHSPQVNTLLHEMFFVPSLRIVEQGPRGIKFVEAQPEWAWSSPKPATQQHMDLVLYFGAVGLAREKGKRRSTNIRKRCQAQGMEKTKVKVNRSWRRTLVAQGIPAKFEAYLDKSQIVFEGYLQDDSCMYWELGKEKRPWEGVTLGKLMDCIGNNVDEELKAQAIEWGEYDSESGYW
ncbi:hypothetical protein PRZ48_012093 [Zasmidium cellare]|uniref:F-box domain-containing protein n=1 Tax=Zasmidium cellare TaxID=395010 RepID=A0ABR0E3Y4_ZASCE|nr:hypothetical protein PRZ48_012093 [Zasmidium cellare]